MALYAADVIAPMFAAAEIVVRLLAGVARQACLGSGLRTDRGESEDLALVTASFDVLFARAMARFAAHNLSFPRGKVVQLTVFRVADAFGLGVVAARARLAADVPVVGGSGRVRDDRRATPAESDSA